MTEVGPNRVGADKRRGVLASRGMTRVRLLQATVAWTRSRCVVVKSLMTVRTWAKRRCARDYGEHGARHSTDEKTSRVFCGRSGTARRREEET